MLVYGIHLILFSLFPSVYVDVGRQSGNPVVLSVVSTGALTHERKWRIKVSMIPCGSLDIGM